MEYKYRVLGLGSPEEMEPHVSIVIILFSSIALSHQSPIGEIFARFSSPPLSMAKHDNSRTHFSGLNHLNFEDHLLSSLNFLLNVDPADVCAFSGDKENVRKDVNSLNLLYSLRTSSLSVVLVFPRFCGVTKIVMAAGRIAEKEGWWEKTFPEQEELTDGI